MRSRKAAGLEPYEVRLRNLVRPEQMPFENVVKKEFDGGDYPAAMRAAVDGHRPVRDSRSDNEETSRTAV